MVAASDHVRLVPLRQGGCGACAKGGVMDDLQLIGFLFLTAAGYLEAFLLSLGLATAVVVSTAFLNFEPVKA